MHTLSDAVVLPITDELDLHHFRPSELGELLLEWLITARAAGFLEVRIIHGKGSGVAMTRVQSILGRCPLVRDWRGAPGGNWGATVARLYAPVTDEGRVREILTGCPRFMGALAAVEALGAPPLWVGGGAVRNPIWHRLQGGEGEPAPSDIDVLWHDSAGQPDERMVAARLRAARPDLDWDVVNQALMANPAPSMAEALGRWPETATCVAARLAGGSLELLAPLGWHDVLALVVRRNTALPEEVFKARLASKRWRMRFPGVTIFR